MARTALVPLSVLILALPASAEIDFAKDVQPIFVEHCLKCHREENDKGDYMMHNRKAAFGDGIVVPGKPDKSIFIELLELDADDDDLMPPTKEGGPLKAEQIKTLRDWVKEGAAWPEDLVLEMPPLVSFERDIQPILDKLSPEEQEKMRQWIKAGAEWPLDDTAALELVGRLHQKIVSTTKVKDATSMAAYTGKVPVSGAPFDMIPLPAGEFVMGSPDGEAKRKATEGPQRKVKIAPFWIGKHEITWDEYESFMVDGGRRKKSGAKMYPDPDDSDVDVISRPTKPYVEMTFGMGKARYPAISMTQHAALTYCKWLSAQTGHFYRLPTEAEWEYACRAGTETAYSFGDSPADIHKYAWFLDNADFAYQKVGTKLPNPWGLHDMHGNVAEWTMDSLTEDGYPAGDADNPRIKNRELYPRVARGGSWNDFPEGLRSATRLGSSGKWKTQDPQLPKSIWYHTDALWLGFRIVRPLEIPSPEEMHAIWNAGIDHDTLE